MKNYFLILIAVISFRTSDLYSQDSKWEQYFDGTSVRCLAAEGEYIWAGLANNGLVRFNKKTMEKVFYNSTNTPVLITSVSDIVIDKYHNKWIASNGVIKYNDTSFVKVSPWNSGILFEQPRALALDSSNNLWVAMFYGGLYKFDGKNWTSYTTFNSQIPSNNITSVLVDSLQNIWFGTNKGLCVFDGHNFRVYDTSNSGLGCNEINCIKLDKSGVMWIGTKERVYSFKNNQWKKFDMNLYRYPQDVTTISVDKNNVIWLGSIVGLSTFAGDKWTYYDNGNSNIKSEYVLHIITDDNNTKWLGSSNIFSTILRKGGLSSFDGKEFKDYDLSNSKIPYHRITAVTVDGNNNVWMGNLDNEIMKFNGSTWSRIHLPENRDGADFEGAVYVDEIAVDKSQNVWVSTYSDGLYKIKDSVIVKKFNMVSSPLPSNSLYDILIDSTNAVWLANDRALVRMGAEGTYFIYNHSNSPLPDARITGVEVDPKGCIWLSTSEGLVKFDADSCRVFNVNNSGLPDNYLYNLAIDKDGRKWAGCQWGLILYDDKEWKLYNTYNSNLPSNDITNIKVDYNNNIWVTSQGNYLDGIGGVTKISKDKWETFHYYNSGINDVSIRDIAFDTYGNKWIAALEGGLLKYMSGDTLKIIDTVKIIPDDNLPIPEYWELKQNYPNPFNPSTTISYSIPKQSHVILTIIDMLGREIQTLVSKEQNPGEYKVQFKGSSLPSGMYIYSIQAGEFRSSKKLLLIK